MITKFDQYIGESVLNISKNKKFPEHYYDIYDLNSKEIGAYLNTWFPGKLVYFSQIEKNKVKSKRGEIKNDFLVTDEMWTVKIVDEESSRHLYNRKYNPIVVSIMCPTGGFDPFVYKKTNEKGEDLFNMISAIESIDDSSYRIWFNNKPLNELKDIRIKIMEWVSSQPIINGHKFLDKCVELGADENSIDLN